MNLGEKMQKINVSEGILNPLDKNAAEEIAQWEYESPYEDYSFKGHLNEYLFNENTWGTEQFCLKDKGIVLG